mmetsp:Transcript_59543/g.140278  ORF Transcript_59543/g.140278 Transcript_59543/m.140278 type:complete len:835 (+) Transcript_59543:252-2756(+)
MAHSVGLSGVEASARSAKSSAFRHVRNMFCLVVCFASQSTSVILPEPPEINGPANGGHFRFATVSWTRLEAQPPKIRFTVEAAFRRDYSAVNFRGSGADGHLVVGDHFKPSGLETIMFDFGDGSMLTPMTFTVEAYSIAEDWVQATCSFDHEYARLTSTTPFKYRATFKGCCRVSDLEHNADTSWSLSTVLNVRDDNHSPRLTVLPLQTLVKKMRPSDPEPSFYLPADDNVFGAMEAQSFPVLKTWEIMGYIGAAPSVIRQTDPPSNLPNLEVDHMTGLITLAAGPVYSAAAPSTDPCLVDDGRAQCMGETPMGMAVPSLAPGLYNAVLQLSQGNSTAPVEVMIRLLEAGPGTQVVVPKLTSADPNLFYPSYLYNIHVGYLGFPVRPFDVTASTALQGVNLGFTVGRLPEGARLSTVRGGASHLASLCAGGTHFCREDTTAACNGTSTVGCTCLPADTGRVCGGVGGLVCRGGSVCTPCFELGECPTSNASLTFTWTPASGQEGTTIVCFDATTEGEAGCAAAGVEGNGGACAAVSSPSQCVNIEVFPDPPPMIWTTFEADVDPFASSGLAYLGRDLVFTVYANDSNCWDVPEISMGPMPPGVSMTEQTSTSFRRSFTVTGSTGMETTTMRECRVHQRRFTWKIPHTYGGYNAEHCFHATDMCGDEGCSAGRDTTTVCVNFTVAKCQYAVNREQSIAEVASIFGTDWIQVWNMNELMSPDYILFRNQVLRVGRLYTVTSGDTILRLADRFGTSHQSIAFLNYEVGEEESSNITVGQQLCLIANSCLGHIQNIWDQNPPVDESLEQWYQGVKSAYEALRDARVMQGADYTDGELR